MPGEYATSARAPRASLPLSPGYDTYDLIQS
jgi:hypothetical protein